MAKLKAWYKKHKNRRHQRVRMLVVKCPERGGVCGVPNVCLAVNAADSPCEFYDGMEFGYIKCNHPKAGGDGNGLEEYEASSSTKEIL